MAESPEARRRRQAAAARRAGKSRLDTGDPYYDYRNGVWYDRDGDATGTSPTEDSEITPIGTKVLPASRNQRSSYRNDGTNPRPASELSPLYTAEDLGKDVTADEAVLTQLNTADDKPLETKRAEAVLTERLTKLNADSPMDAVELAPMILGALPKALRTVSVLNAIDLRPYLMAIDGKVIDHLGGDLGGMQVGPGGMVLPTGIYQADYRADTKGFVDAENARIRLVLEASGDATKAAQAASFPIDKAGINPAANGPEGVPIQPATKTIESIDANGDAVWTSVAADQATTGTVAFPTEDLRRLVNAGIYDLEQAAAEEIALQQPGQPGAGSYFPVDIGQTPAPIPQLSDPNEKYKVNQTVSIVDAMNYVQGLKPSEVHSLQLKLAAGGYFDRLESGGAYVEGMAFDQNTNNAWRLLIKDAIQQKRSAPAILGEQIRDYRSNQRDSRMRQLSRLDPTYVDAIGNDFAQANLGRDFTVEERAQVVGLMNKLRYERAGYIAGAANTADSPLQGQYGIDQTDVESAAAKLPGVGFEKVMRGSGELLYRLNQVLG